MLTQADQARIAEAITAAERTTRGEVFCVLAQEVSRYREVPLAWAALAALVGPMLLMLAGFGWLVSGDIFTGWSNDNMQAGLGALSSYTLLQAGLFAVVALIVAQPPIRRVLTPRFLKRHRVRQMARQHFAAAGARLDQNAPHILIYAALQDRQVELVAHEGIHRVVGEGPWNDAVAAVRGGMKMGQPGDGFVRAIEICGAALARHFPPDGPSQNRFPNQILVT